jgi:hypothetical protein
MWSIFYFFTPALFLRVRGTVRVTPPFSFEERNKTTPPPKKRKKKLGFFFLTRDVVLFKPPKKNRFSFRETLKRARPNPIATQRKRG